MLFTKLIASNVIKNILDARSVKNNENKTALAEHATSYKHSFDFKNTKFLDIENNMKKRLFLEMIYIQKENS